LSCSSGNWTGTAPITYSYQWQRNGVDIAGKTGSTYTTTTTDVDKTLKCWVTARNSAGSTPVVSANSMLITTIPVSTNEYPTPLPGQTYTVTSQSEFTARLGISKPGDLIIVDLASGGLDAVNMSRSGTAANPIVVKSKVNQGTVVNGNVTLSGDFVQFCQFKLGDGRRAVLSGTGCRLHRCRVKYSGGRGIICTAGSRQVMLSHCEIDGSMISSTAVGLCGVHWDPATNQRNVIRRCWWHGMTQVEKPGDDQSALFAGISQGDTAVRSGNVMEYCLMEDWKGDAETIANKSSLNTYRFVTILNSKQFSQRHGKDNVYWGCYSKGSTGWDIFDGGNQLLGCKCEDTDIHVSNGEVTSAGFPNNTGPTLGNHPQAANTIVAGCFGPLVLGRTGRDEGKGYDEPALNTRIEKHDRAYTPGGMHTGTTQEPNLSPGRLVPTPRLITRDEVGVTAAWDGG
jgi:hypothetical protein